MRLQPLLTLYCLLHPVGRLAVKLINFVVLIGRNHVVVAKAAVNGVRRADEGGRSSPPIVCYSKYEGNQETGA